MVYACFLACYDYAVLALISFLPHAPITVEPICFECTFKIIKIYHQHDDIQGRAWPHAEKTSADDDKADDDKVLLMIKLRALK